MAGFKSSAGSEPVSEMAGFGSATSGEPAGTLAGFETSASYCRTYLETVSRRSCSSRAIRRKDHPCCHKVTMDCCWLILS